MLSGALARRYAEALFELAQKTSLDQTEEELRGLVELVHKNAGVEQILHHPHIPLAQKKDVMNGLLGAGVSLLVRNFLFLLIDRRREQILNDVLREFSRLANEARHIVEAHVASAQALSPDQQERLREKLERLTGKRVRLICTVQPQLIGGVLVKVGDRVIDGTVAHALDRMREELLKTSGNRG